MNRILTRIDHEGNPVVFLPDTYKEGLLKAWYGQADKEPETVTIEYYKSTKDLDEKDDEQRKTKERLKRQAEKKFNNAPIFLMQRFPRNLLKDLKEEVKTTAEVVVKGPVVPEAEKAHYRAVKAVRAGTLWEIQDANGETIEIVADKAVALRTLEQQAMTMH